MSYSGPKWDNTESVLTLFVIMDFSFWFGTLNLDGSLYMYVSMGYSL